MPNEAEISLNYAPISNYILNISRFPNLPFYISAVNMPDFSLGQTEISNPYITMKTAGSSLTVGDVMLTFIVDKYLENYFILLDWIFAYKNIEINDDPSIKLITQKIHSCDPGNLNTDAALTFLTSDKNPFLTVNYKNCYPSMISGFMLESQGQLDFLRCDLTLSFSNLTYKRVKIG